MNLDLGEFELRPFEKVALPQSDKGKRIKQRDYLPQGKLPVVDQGQSNIGGYTDDESMCFSGSLPAVIFGDHTRAVKLVNHPFAVGADGIKIFSPAADVLPKYLYYWMKSAPIENRGYGRHYQYLRKLNVPVPSVANQQAIAAEIEKQFSRLDEAVANLQRVKANLKRYKASVLKAAVEGRLVNGDTAVEQAHDKGKWLPISLAIKSLDQGWSPKCENEPRTDVQEWAVMRTTAVQEMQFLPDENKRLPMGLEPRSQLELMEGDLLITRAGPRNRVGITCLVKATSSRLMLCDKAYRLRTNLNLALPAYLEVVLNSPTVIDILDEMKSGISDSGLNLTQKRFSELLVPLPSLSAQAEIVAEVDRHLSIAREVEADVDINLKRAQALRQATLRSAFNRVEVG